MSNATLSTLSCPWLIVLDPWVFGYLFVGFVKTPLPLLWALFICLWVFVLFLGVKFKS
jgi:hypothetical protein